ncbi:haloacid dehalogenase-like hydrolase [Gimesia maris]|uniref:HAD family hydrolase n=1 Tax=Gimesia maris TaxID=122 RepID=UPI001189798D|nr:HAD family hydrolase [Gimesia maris]QDU17459.1 haloacid dehalogenase-like hydrolase [Gimesia maris]
MKLLVLDVEGTIFKTKIRLPGATIDSTIWQSIADALGSEAVAAEVATHKKWDSGKYGSYLEWMKDTIRIHKEFKLTQEVFERVISAAEYQVDFVETLKKVNREKYEPVLVTGGFRELARRVQVDCQISHAFAACEYIFDKGVLASFNLLPCDFAGKLDFVHLMLREYGLSDEDWIFVGDGRNDVPIALDAPYSIGYKPHPELNAVVDKTITDYSDLTLILS